MRNCIIQITKWTCTFVASLCFIGAAGVAKAGDVYLSPIAVAAASDGSTLYIAEFTAGRVAVLDVASNTITHNIPLAAPNQASSLVLSPDGTKLYVTAADPDGQVYVISTATNTVVDTLPAGHTPTAAAVFVYALAAAVQFLNPLMQTTGGMMLSAVGFFWQICIVAVHVGISHQMDLLQTFIEFYLLKILNPIED